MTTPTPHRFLRFQNRQQLMNRKTRKVGRALQWSTRDAFGGQANYSFNAPRNGWRRPMTRKQSNAKGGPMMVS